MSSNPPWRLRVQHEQVETWYLNFPILNSYLAAPSVVRGEGKPDADDDQEEFEEFNIDEDMEQFLQSQGGITVKFFFILNTS